MNRTDFGVPNLDAIRSEELKRMIERACAAYEAMTPEQKQYHDHEQRRSFVRGMCPSKRDYNEWRDAVDRLLPPLPRPAT